MQAEAETKVVEARSKPSRPNPTPSSGLPHDRQIGRYDLLHRIGHGGMATVYLGRAVGTAGFEKLVAVKVIHPHLANEPDFVEMFLDEARIAARIRHPNVVETLDLGREGDAFFMVMEFVEGDTLATLLRELRSAGELLPVPSVLRMVADACEGLAAAHDLVDPDGVPYHLVHRDISPHNLLAGLDGRVRVVDFGIMKAAGKRSNTLTGQLRGKLQYMSPEQARGHAIDRRTDVFALGAVMWELLTNTRLVSGETESEILAHVCQFTLPEIEELRADLPPAVRRILARALEPDLERRYVDTHEMLRDLRTALRACESAEDPRESIAAMMKRYFEDRIAYVRASAKPRSAERSAERRADLELDDDSRPDRSRTPTAVVGRATESSPLREFPEIPTQVTETTPPRGGRSWTLLLALPLFGAALGTAIVTYAQRGRDPVAPELEPRITETELLADAADAAAAQAPTFVRWVFNTEPQGASVTIEGRRLEGTTPLSIEMERSAEPVSVRLEHEGFESYEAELAPVGAQNHGHRFVPLRTESRTTAVVRPTLRFSARKSTRPKTSPAPDESTTPPVAPPAPSGDGGPELADMPDLTRTKPRPPGN